VNPRKFSTVRLQQPKVGKAYTSWFCRSIGNEGDFLSVGRPTRVEVIVLAEGQLVGCPAIDWNDVQMAILIGCAASRRIDKTPAFWRYVWECAIQRMLTADLSRFRNSL